jgi:hypothetical protein
MAQIFASVSFIRILHKYFVLVSRSPSQNHISLFLFNYKDRFVNEHRWCVKESSLNRHLATGKEEMVLVSKTYGVSQTALPYVGSDSFLRRSWPVFKILKGKH